jgi:hypothetical protein
MRLFYFKDVIKVYGTPESHRSHLKFTSVKTVQKQAKVFAMQEKEADSVVAKYTHSVSLNKFLGKIPFPPELIEKIMEAIADVYAPGKNIKPILRTMINAAIAAPDFLNRLSHGFNYLANKLPELPYHSTKWEAILSNPHQSTIKELRETAKELNISFYGQKNGKNSSASRAC